MANVDNNAVVPKRSWHSPSGRALSILAALGSAAGIVWFLGLRASWNPAEGATELFWMRVFCLFVANALLQQWTLAYETGRGDEFWASADKFIALAPLAAFGGCEILEIGRFLGDSSPGKVFLLNWRHHIVGAAWAVYSIVDFFATDMTNQRLRALQFAPPRA